MMLNPRDGSVESTLSVAGLKEHAIHIPKTFNVYPCGRRDAGARPLDQGADPEAFRSQRVDLSHRRILQHNVCAKRSEERRVGKECRSQKWQEHIKKKIEQECEDVIE